MGGVTIEIRRASGEVHRRTRIPCAHAERIVAPAARPHSSGALLVVLAEYCEACGAELGTVDHRLVNPRAVA